MHFASKVLRFNEKTTRDSDCFLDQDADIRKIKIVKSPNVRKAWEVDVGSTFLPAALDDDAAAIGKPAIPRGIGRERAIPIGRDIWECM